MKNLSKHFVLSYLQHLPKQGSFQVRNLPLTANGAQMAVLRDAGYLNFKGYSLNAHRSRICNWEISHKGHTLLNSTDKIYPTALKPRISYHTKSIDIRHGYISKDFKEVENYLKTHPNATIFDVALECHMSDNQAHRLMQKCRSQEERRLPERNE